MSLFSFTKSSERIGALVDIGSASVLVAIVSSVQGREFPHVIWSHREHTPLKQIDSLEQSAKAVMTSLMNALMKLDSEGRRALHEYNTTSKIPVLHCTVAAPWSYTVTKSINYNQTEPFELTKSLIEELLKSAGKTIAEELKENDVTSNLGLQVISRSTSSLQANGYQIEGPREQLATTLTLSLVSAVTQQYLLDNLNNLKEKLVPEAEIQATSYMLAFYSTASQVYAHMTDVCLVHISYEATEIGVVRDGVLAYTTHTPFGSFSLAREISAITGAPLFEAFQYLRSDNPLSFMEGLSDAKRIDVEQMLEAYVAKLQSLFMETGDDLSIPKKIIIHADLKSETFFKDIINNAAKRILKSDPDIKMITPNLFNEMTHGAFAHKPQELPDSAMLVSAQFFHTDDDQRFFEYL